MTTPADPQVSRATRWAGGVGILLVGAAGVWLGRDLYHIAVATGGAFLWDPAHHGVNGVRLAQDLGGGNLFAFLRDVNALRHWPFLHPILLALAFLGGGTGREVAIGLSVWALLATGLVTYVAALSYDRWNGVATGLLAAVGLASGPLTLYYGVLVMLEVFCALCSILCVLAYVDYTALPTRGRAWGVALSTTALCFAKYNYGMFWGLTLVICEIARLPAEQRRGLCRWLVGWVAVSTLRRPSFWIAAALAAAIAAIRATGGWSGEIVGIRISITTIGNPVYVLLLFLTARMVYELAARREVWRNRLPEGVRVFLWGTIAPLGVWFLLCSPGRVKEFVDWLQSGSNYQVGPFTEAMAVYLPRVRDGFLPTMVLQVLAGVGFAVGLLRATREGVRGWAPILYFGIAAAACAAHPFKDPRFLVPLAPVFWLVVAAGAMEVLSAFRTPVVRRGGQVLLVAAMAAGLANRLPEFLAGEFVREYPAYYAAHSLIDTERSVGELVGEAKKVSIFGSCNEVSHHAIEWAVREASGGAVDAFEIRRSRPRPKRLEEGPDRERLAFAYWLEYTDADVVVAVEVPPSSPLYEGLYPRADQEAVHLLADQVVFRPFAVVLDHDTGVVVHIYRR